jgi:hypothetical protein
MRTVDLVGHARELLDANRYLTIGTVDADGTPWTSPVYFAAADEREFYWVSAIDARHSRNLAVRPQVSVVVFDSSVLPYHGRALYATGTARELAGADLDRGLAVYPGSSTRELVPVDRADVTEPEVYRLYGMTPTDVWVLCPREPRRPCQLHGLNQDHRAPVPLAG